MSVNLPPDPLRILEICLEKYLSGQVNSAKSLVSKNTLWIAYSGGLDSTVLLNTAVTYAQSRNVSVKAVHVNHNLSANATEWQQHCQAQCQTFGIDLVVKSVQLKTEGKGLEAAARDARYAAIAQEVQQGDLVLLGQHQNDQVETFFLQLLRGAGPVGLSGMVESSVNEYGTQLLRPFLSLSRAQLHQQAVQDNLTWIEDESNQNTDFDRNFLRNDILPELKKRRQNADTAIIRSMSHIQEQQVLLNECVAEKLAQLLTEQEQSEMTGLAISGLVKHGYAWQKHIIKYWLAQNGAQQPSEKVLERILKDCIEAREDAQPKVSWGRWQCCRFAGQLYVLAQLRDLSGTVISVKVGEPIELPDGSGSYLLSADATKNDTKPSLNIRPGAKLDIRFGGFTQRFKPHGVAHSKPLNQWFKQWQVPPWERVRTPLLFADGELVAVGHVIALGVSALKGQSTSIDLQWASN